MGLSFRDRVAEYFLARPLVWVNAIDLERVGGRQGWRTRTSECRVQLGMVIENRCRREYDWTRGESFTISEYRFVPCRTLLEIVPPIQLERPARAGYVDDETGRFHLF